MPRPALRRPGTPWRHERCFHAVQAHRLTCRHLDSARWANDLERIQASRLASLYEAMPAGVDDVLMGVGISRLLPGTLDRLSPGEPAELPIQVNVALAEVSHVTRFDPGSFAAGPPPAS